MSNLTKGLIVIAAVLAVGIGLVFWKKNVAGHGGSLNSISAEEMQLILKDADPMMLKRMAENPEIRKDQAENLKQLLAVASQARKEGFDQKENIAHELENIEAEILAVSYDKEINKDKGPMPPFGFIDEARVKEFWGAKPETNTFWSKIGLGGTSEQRRHEEEFKQFLDSKIALLKESNPAMKEQELTEEQKQQAKEYFAKIKIYEKEAKENMGKLGEEFKKKVELQTKLQQAQLLAQLYSREVLAKKAEVTDEDVKKYIAANPDLNPETKKTKALEILKRAKSGEDFAKLADEFSQDPGNKDPEGNLQGGIYKDVSKGQMMPEFEQAALGLEPGGIADNLVETPYGYHIVKLERKGASKDAPKDAEGNQQETYDVRHILLTTTVKDPNNPMGREMPVEDFVRAKLESEKQKQVLDEIVANNPVSIPEDFKVPEPSQEQIEQMQKQQQQQMEQQMQQMQQQQMPQGEDMPKPPAEDGDDAPKPKQPKK